MANLIDDLDIYHDLDDFQEQEEKKSKEYESLAKELQDAQAAISALQAEKKNLHAKVRQLKVNFQALLDTTRTEINRKDRQIFELRAERDSICFRRKAPIPQMANQHTEMKAAVYNPFRQAVIKHTTQPSSEERNKPKDMVFSFQDKETEVSTAKQSKQQNNDIEKCTPKQENDSKNHSKSLAVSKENEKSSAHQENDSKFQTKYSSKRGDHEVLTAKEWNDNKHHPHRSVQSNETAISMPKQENDRKLSRKYTPEKRDSDKLKVINAHVRHKEKSPRRNEKNEKSSSTTSNSSSSHASRRDGHVNRHRDKEDHRDRRRSRHDVDKKESKSVAKDKESHSSRHREREKYDANKRDKSKSENRVSAKSRDDEIRYKKFASPKKRDSDKRSSRSHRSSRTNMADEKRNDSLRRSHREKSDKTSSHNSVPKKEEGKIGLRNGDVIEILDTDNDDGSREESQKPSTKQIEILENIKLPTLPPESMQKIIRGGGAILKRLSAEYDFQTDPCSSKVLNSPFKTTILTEETLNAMEDVEKEEKMKDQQNGVEYMEVIESSEDEDVINLNVDSESDNERLAVNSRRVTEADKRNKEVEDNNADKRKEEAKADTNFAEVKEDKELEELKVVRENGRRKELKPETRVEAVKETTEKHINSNKKTAINLNNFEKTTEGSHPNKNMEKELETDNNVVDNVNNDLQLFGKKECLSEENDNGRTDKLMNNYEAEYEAEACEVIEVDAIECKTTETKNIIKEKNNNNKHKPKECNDLIRNPTNADIEVIEDDDKLLEKNKNIIKKTIVNAVSNIYQLRMKRKSACIVNKIIENEVRADETKETKNCKIDNKNIKTVECNNLIEDETDTEVQVTAFDNKCVEKFANDVRETNVNVVNKQFRNIYQMRQKTKAACKAYVKVEDECVGESRKSEKSLEGSLETPKTFENKNLTATTKLIEAIEIDNTTSNKNNLINLLETSSDNYKDEEVKGATIKHKFDTYKAKDEEFNVNTKQHKYDNCEVEELRDSTFHQQHSSTPCIEKPNETILETTNFEDIMYDEVSLQIEKDRESSKTVDLFDELFGSPAKIPTANDKQRSTKKCEKQTYVNDNSQLQSPQKFNLQHIKNIVDSCTKTLTISQTAVTSTADDSTQKLRNQLSEQSLAKEETKCSATLQSFKRTRSSLNNSASINEDKADHSTEEKSQKHSTPTPVLSTFDEVPQQPTQPASKRARLCDNTSTSLLAALNDENSCEILESSPKTTIENVNNLLDNSLESKQKNVTNEQDLLSRSYQDLDEKMQHIFGSSCEDISKNESLLRDVSAELSKSTCDNIQHVTIEDTAVTLTNCSSLEQSSGTCMNSSAETKVLTMGSSEYRFEKISDNVINLFITRKRRPKKTKNVK